MRSRERRSRGSTHKRGINMRFDSENLLSQIMMKMEETGSKSDQSYMIYPSTSADYTSIMTSFYIFGNFPWEEGEPKILYSWHPTDNNFLQYMFPFGQTFSFDTFPNKETAISNLFKELGPLDFSFETHYFSQLKEPYLFCFTVQVNAISIPSFVHNLSFSDILSQCIFVPNSLRRSTFSSRKYSSKRFESYQFATSKICFAFHTKLPYFTFFIQILKLIFSGELISKLNVLHDFENFFDSRALPLEIPEKWPYSTRNLSFDHFMFMKVPQPGQCVTIYLPFPAQYSWECPNTERPIDSLVLQCLKAVVRNLDAKVFIGLFAAVLLERSIIIYSRDHSVLTQVIQVFLFLCRPMKFTSTLVSLLPESLSELLESPTPYLIGYVKPLQTIESHQVYLDIGSKTLTCGDSIPSCSHVVQLYKTINKVWNENGVSKILESISKVLNFLLEQVKVGILTDISVVTQPQARFVDEAYLYSFSREDREFMGAFSSTQMFRFYVEQLCLKTSQQNKVYSNTPE